MIDLTHDPRAALEIRRYHTWKVFNGRTVGEHSAQIMRIMLCIWPQVPRKLLVHAVFHDIEEPAGDIPYPFKKDNPGLKREYDEVARKVRLTMVACHKIPEAVVLDEMEEKFFKMCEFIEMWEFGLSEVNMGNQYAVIIAERCIIAANKILGDLHPNMQDDAKRYVANRMKQENPNG